MPHATKVGGLGNLPTNSRRHEWWAQTMHAQCLPDREIAGRCAAPEGARCWPGVVGRPRPSAKKVGCSTSTSAGKTVRPVRSKPLASRFPARAVPQSAGRPRPNHRSTRSLVPAHNRCASAAPTTRLLGTLSFDRAAGRINDCSDGCGADAVRAQLRHARARAQACPKLLASINTSH